MLGDPWSWRIALSKIDISKLNPGPSGEDADAVGQPRDVGSPRASAR